MADLCVAVLVGRLTRDAELKYTSSGQAVCHFAVATSSRKKKGDQWVDESSFWDVDLWGKQAESLAQYLTKGKLVAVEGAMRQDRWEQDGQQRMKVLISANSVNFVGGNSGSYAAGKSPQSSQQYNDGQQYGQGQQFNQGQNGQRSQANSGGMEEVPPGDDFTDDIPF